MRKHRRTIKGTNRDVLEAALCRSKENMSTSVVCTKKSITPSSPKSVTRNFSNRQLKNFAKWKPTTSITAKERSRSRLPELVVNFSMGLGFPARRVEHAMLRTSDLPKWFGKFN